MNAIFLAKVFCSCMLPIVPQFRLNVSYRHYYVKLISLFVLLLPHHQTFHFQHRLQRVFQNDRHLVDF